MSTNVHLAFTKCVRLLCTIERLMNHPADVVFSSRIIHLETSCYINQINGAYCVYAAILMGDYDACDIADSTQLSIFLNKTREDSGYSTHTFAS